MFKWLGIVLSALSVVKLIQLGLMTEGFAAPLQLIINWYDAFLKLILSWADPLLQRMVNYVGSYFSLELTIYSHWKHVFILIWLYAATMARNAWGTQLKIFAIFRFLWGGVTGLFLSIVVGVIPLSGKYADALLPMAVTLGLSLFQYGNNLWVNRAWGGDWESKWPRMYFDRYHWLKFFAFGLPISFLGFAADFIPILNQSQSLGIALILLVVLSLSIYWLGFGFFCSIKDKLEHETLHESIKRSTTFKQGLLLAYVLIGAAAFVLANAGLVLIESLSV